MKYLWSFVWFLFLVLVAIWVALLACPFYILINMLTVCVPDLMVCLTVYVRIYLFQLDNFQRWETQIFIIVKFPRHCVKMMMIGKPMCVPVDKNKDAVSQTGGNASDRKASSGSTSSSAASEVVSRV